MNKAFVREPDDTLDARCPRCGVIGTGVAQETLRAHLSADDVKGLSDTAYFCANPRCEVGYYDALGQTVGRERVKRSLYPKEAGVPICSCFGLTADAVEADARAGRPEGERALIAKSKTDAANCTINAANGTCCVAEVQKLYLKFATGKTASR